MEQTKLYIVMSFKDGVPYEGPQVTTHDWLAGEYYEDFCQALGLDKECPHNGEADVWSWELVAKDVFSEVELVALGMTKA